MKHKITMKTFLILMFLAENKKNKYSVYDLSCALKMSSGLISQAITRMETDGLAKSQRKRQNKPCQPERRMCSITLKGIYLYQRMKKRIEVAINDHTQ